MIGCLKNEVSWSRWQEISMDTLVTKTNHRDFPELYFLLLIGLIRKMWRVFIQSMTKRRNLYIKKVFPPPFRGLVFKSQTSSNIVLECFRLRFVPKCLRFLSLKWLVTASSQWTITHGISMLASINTTSDLSPVNYISAYVRVWWALRHTKPKLYEMGNERLCCANISSRKVILGFFKNKLIFTIFGVQNSEAETASNVKPAQDLIFISKHKLLMQMMISWVEFV